MITMKALSLKNPWPYFIFDLPEVKSENLAEIVQRKLLENRSRMLFGPKFYNQTILIHASKGMSKKYWNWTLRWVRERGIEFDHEAVYRSLEFGGIVGYTRVTGVISPSGKGLRDIEPFQSRWRMENQFSYILDPTHTARVDFVPCAGSRGLWDVPSLVAEQVRASTSVSL